MQSNGVEQNNSIAHRPWRPNRLQRLSIGGVIFLLALRFAYPSQQAKIKYQLSRLSSAASITEQESDFLAHLKAKRLKTYFIAKPLVNLNVRYRTVPPIKRQDELASTYSKLRQTLQFLKIDFKETQLINIDTQHALVRAQVKAQLSSDKDHYQQVPVSIAFEKVQGLWKISELKNLEPFEL